MRLLWLADHYRDWGFEPIEVDGWRDRGSDSYEPRVFVDHHTGGGLGWAPSLGVCINGRAGIPGPLCNLFTPRNPNGVRQVHIVASGRANNAGAGGWHGFTGNSRTFGHERENQGGAGDPWQPWQTTDAIAAAACFFDGMRRYHGVVLDASFYAEHKDWAPTRKIDAHSITGNDMRARVAQLLDPANQTPNGRGGIMFLVHPDDRATVYLCTIGDDGRVKYLGLEDADDRDRAAKTYPLLEVKAATWRAWGGGA